MGYIYKLTNKITGLRYIGYTTNPIEVRFRQHIKTSKNVRTSMGYTKLAKALREYKPENFLVEQVEEIQQKNLSYLDYVQKLKEREIYWIAFFGTFPNEYNMTPGGDGGQTIPTKQHREKIGHPVLQYDLNGNFIAEYISTGEAAEKTKTNQNEINRCCTRARNTYSANHYIWKKKDDNTPISIWVELNQQKFGKKQIIQYNLQGQKINEYFSIADAILSLGLKESAHASICDACNKKQITAYNFIWRYKDDKTPLPTQEEIQRSIKSNKKRPVLQFDLNGNFIQEFPSVTAAGKALNVKSPGGSIGEACRGKQKTSHGYIWKFKE